MKYNLIIILLICFVFGQNTTKFQGKINVGATIISSVVLLAFDEDIRSFASKNLDKNIRCFAQYSSDIGSPILVVSAFSTVWLGGAFSKNKSLTLLGKNGFLALSISGISTEVIKHLTSRERPKIANNSTQWHGPKMFFSRYFSAKNPDNFSSFPSGHSALAWAAATILSEHFNHKGTSFLLYSSAFAVSISRIILEEHWASDVAFGAGIGYFIGKNIENKHFQILPKITKTQQGIEIITNL